MTKRRMKMDRKTRENLNSLSKKAFGKSSKWQKLVNNGIYEPYERDREVMVPRANGTAVKKVFTDKKFVCRRYTVEEVTKLMTDILATKNSSPELSNEVGSPQEVTPAT